MTPRLNPTMSPTEIITAWNASVPIGSPVVFGVVKCLDTTTLSKAYIERGLALILLDDIEDPVHLSLVTVDVKRIRSEPRPVTLAELDESDIKKLKIELVGRSVLIKNLEGGNAGALVSFPLDDLLGDPLKTTAQGVAVPLAPTADVRRAFDIGVTLALNEAFLGGMLTTDECNQLRNVKGCGSLVFGDQVEKLLTYRYTPVLDESTTGEDRIAAGLPLEKLPLGIPLEDLVRSSLPPYTELAAGAEIDASAIGGPKRYIVHGAQPDPRMGPSCSPTLDEYRCPRCGIGIDDDGDGDCGVCAGLSEAKLETLKGNLVRHGPPSYCEPPAVMLKTGPLDPEVVKRINAYMAEIKKGADWQIPIIVPEPDRPADVNRRALVLTRKVVAALHELRVELGATNTPPVIPTESMLHPVYCSEHGKLTRYDELNSDGCCGTCDRPIYSVPVDDKGNALKDEDWTTPPETIEKVADRLVTAKAPPTDQAIDLARSGFPIAMDACRDLRIVDVRQNDGTWSRLQGGIDAVRKGMVFRVTDRDGGPVEGEKPRHQMALAIEDATPAGVKVRPWLPTDEQFLGRVIREPIRKLENVSVSFVSGTSEELKAAGLRPVNIRAEIEGSDAVKQVEELIELSRGIRTVELRCDDGTFEPFPDGLSAVKRGMVFRMREPDGRIVDEGDRTEVAVAVKDAYTPAEDPDACGVMVEPFGVAPDDAYQAFAFEIDPLKHPLPAGALDPVGPPIAVADAYREMTGRDMSIDQVAEQLDADRPDLAVEVIGEAHEHRRHGEHLPTALEADDDDPRIAMLTGAAAEVHHQELEALGRKMADQVDADIMGTRRVELRIPTEQVAGLKAQVLEIRKGSFETDRDIAAGTIVMIFDIAAGDELPAELKRFERIDVGSRPEVAVEIIERPSPSADGTGSEICPECGRWEARNVEQVATGSCPKKWAPMDQVAEDDCMRAARERGEK